MVDSNVIKIKLGMFKNKIINDYGIYDYFNYSDGVMSSKAVSVMIDGVYYFCMGRDDKYYHHDLLHKITKKFGNPQLYIFACDNNIAIWKSSAQLDSLECEAVVDVVLELKKYYIDYGIVKNISFEFMNYAGAFTSDKADDFIFEFKNKMISMGVKSYRKDVKN